MTAEVKIPKKKSKNNLGERTSEADYNVALKILLNIYGVIPPEGTSREKTVEAVEELLSIEKPSGDILVEDIDKIIQKYFPVAPTELVKPEQQNT